MSTEHIQHRAKVLLDTLAKWPDPATRQHLCEVALNREFDEGHEAGFEAGMAEAARSIGENGL